ncbi:hypothetical protein [Arsenicibacter rosenii]|uniref:hypothetical protein n=1 Tax=Arsenicibacter rosenii TaxID=1750698 RepID=UPI0011604E0D|nr:hypothetical protein [Arsenicibacter rosenii]
MADTASEASIITLQQYQTGTYDGYHDSFQLPIVAEERANYSDSIAIRLTDNSMSPRLTVGMQLRARPVPVSDWDYLNSTVVAVLYRSTLVVRRIKENDLLSRGYLTLYADSPDAGYVHVRREDLKSIWRAIEIISGEIE